MTRIKIRTTTFPGAIYIESAALHLGAIEPGDAFIDEHALETELRDAGAILDDVAGIYIDREPYDAPFTWKIYDVDTESSIASIEVAS
jgi:hypothetical protein